MSAIDPRRLLGKNLRMARARTMLSQEKLAEKAHLHRTYIGAVERGETNISLINLFKLASALGVDAAELIRK